MKKTIIISPTAYVLEDSVDTVIKKRPDLFKNATSGYEYSFHYSKWNGGGRTLIAYDECARHSKFDAGNLILSPFGGIGSIVVETGIKPLLLRSALLYWDSIDLPIANCGTDFLADDTDIELLEREQILTRFEVELEDEGLSLADVFYGLYLNKNRISRPEHFLYSTTLGQDISASPRFWTPSPSDLVMALYNALPVPSEDVPIEDILNFKSHRHDEFDQFKKCMDNFESAIMKERSQKALKKQLDELSKILRVIYELMGESRIKRFLTSRTVSLRIPGPETVLSTLVGLFAGAGADIATSGQIGIISLAVGTAMSFFSFPQTEKSQLATDYRYIMGLINQFQISEDRYIGDSAEQ